MTNELELPKVVRRGDSGPEVHRIQDWLVLRGHGVKLDGVFGPATELALRTFQKTAKVDADGVVTPELFRVLNAPMRAAVEAVPVSGATSLGDLLVQYATRHLIQQPREVGGDNRGPWVRLYMDGHQGTRWRWCAGFVTFCLQQACSTLRLPPPVVEADGGTRELALPAEFPAAAGMPPRQQGRLVAIPDGMALLELSPPAIVILRQATTSP